MDPNIATFILFFFGWILVVSKIKEGDEKRGNECNDLLLFCCRGALQFIRQVK